ncbi:MAG: STAS domain-containing protein [bacterium]
MPEVNVSIIKIRDVLMATIPPNPDDATITGVQERVLAAMDQYSPKGLVLDITSVDTLDSFFARTIAETARMVALMGGRTVVVGMHPSVAITATQLGLTLGSAETALDVEKALDRLQDERLGGEGHEHPRR